MRLDVHIIIIIFFLGGGEVVEVILKKLQKRERMKNEFTSWALKSRN